MRLLYFYHVPKTAGSFVRSRLLQLFAATGEAWTEHGFFAGETRKDICAALRDSRNLTGVENVFIHHHHHSPGLLALRGELASTREAMEAERALFFAFTCLREPLSHAESRVNYLKQWSARQQSRAERTLAGHSAILNGLTYERIIREPEQHNYQSKYLLYNHPSMWTGTEPPVELGEVQGVVHDVFDRVYRQERVEEVLDDVADLLGVRRTAGGPRVNVTLRKTQDISPEQRRSLLKVNAIDALLFDRADVLGRARHERDGIDLLT